MYTCIILYRYTVGPLKPAKTEDENEKCVCGVHVVHVYYMYMYVCNSICTCRSIATLAYATVSFYINIYF